MQSFFLCVRCGDRPAVDFLLNVLLFIPFTIGLGLLRVRAWRALGAAIALSCSIEALQYFVIVGRYASLRDIVANSFGSIVGFALGHSWQTLLLPDRRSAIRLYAMGTGSWIVVQALTAWALGISPLPPPWWAQFKPHHRRYAGAFSGKVLQLSIGSMVARVSDSLADAEVGRQALLFGEPLQVIATGVHSARGIEPVAIVSAGPVYDVGMWALRNNDGIFMVSVRGTRLGLRTPLVRIRNVVPTSPTDTLLLSGRYFAGRYELRAVSGGRREIRTLEASPNLTWTFFLPIPLYALGGATPLFTAIWIAGIWLVLGYWAGRGAALTDLKPLFGSVAAMIAGLVIVPELFGIPAAHGSEWLAVVGAGSVGALIARRAIRAIGQTSGGGASGASGVS